MENQIITGISQKLFETFGATYTIYTENVEQYLRPPCFYIELVQSSLQQIISRRYKSDNLFDIHFFTDQSEPKSDFRRVADILYDALEYISVENDLMRGLNMHYEIVDDVLHFLVNYNFVSKKEAQTADKMETLQTRSELA